MKLLTKSNDPNTTLGWLERISYGLGNSGNAVVYGFVASFLTFFYTDVIGLNAGILGTIFLISRVFDGITDIVMGHIVDRTKTKTGKARCWILRLCIPYAIGGVLLFTVPEGSAALQYTYVFVSYNVVNAILFTGISVPYNSLTSLSTTNPYERGLLGIFPMLGSVLVGVIMSSTVLNMVEAFGGGRKGWIITSGMWAVIGLACHLICYFGTKERVLDTKTTEKDDVSFKDGILSLIKNYYWIVFTIVLLLLWLMTGLVQTAAVYYTNTVLENQNLYAPLYNIQSVTQMVFLAVAAIFIKRIGKVNTFRLGIVIEIIGTVIRVFFSTNVPVLMTGGFLIGAGGGFAGAVFVGIIADIIDYGHWKTGVKVVGLGMASSSFVQKIGYGLASSLWGLMLSAGGYDGTAVRQTASAITSIKMGYIYLPCILTILMLILVIKFPLDKVMPKVRGELEERKQGN